MTVPERIAALPCWQGNVQAEPLSGGLSNEIWKVTDAAGAHVVRLGKDYPAHHVSRAREAMASRAAHAAGFAPAVEFTAPGVMVTRFLDARTWGPQDVAENPVRVADLLRGFHRDMQAQVSGEAYFFWVFHVIRDYARTLTGTRHEARLPRFLRIAGAMEAEQVPLPIVFSHNDLLPANFLDDGARLWLIDFEYAGWSTALFDLAGVAANAEMDAAAAQDLLAAYFGQAPDAALARAFAAMQVAALIRETLWALVSDLHLAAPGVDYTAYAAENLTRLEASLDAFQAQFGKIGT
ncbi:choline/ethanolamine kinase family protein [Szabonella alba]|uniref:Phosphotransferase family protein n=1 Tax=Szabonella alba TaxID=2804194 RepID=A0A8K0V7C6_9RHOB|nr:choline/ethanolamine kinase family protein [Szabonella alba]MBL4916481.1 phosphotransferase family protein [Szabonella alba]